MFAPGVPLKKIKAIISNCPKGIKVISCHQPLAFKSCKRRWVTKNIWAIDRINKTTITNKNITYNKRKNFSSSTDLNIDSTILLKLININIVKNLNIYSWRLDLPFILNQPLNNKLYNLLLVTTKLLFSHNTKIMFNYR